MENKLIKLPFVDMRKDSIGTTIENGDLNIGELFLFYDCKQYCICIVTKKVGNSVDFKNLLNLDSDYIVNDEQSYSKDRIDELNKRLKEKQSLINNLRDKNSQLSCNYEQLVKRSKAISAMYEELKSTKKNSCSGWISENTLVNIVELLTNKK